MHRIGSGRLYRALGLLALVLAAALPASAQQDQPDTPAEAMQRCAAGEGGALLTVQSCSWAIHTGRLTDDGLAVALLRRGVAYDELGQDARAAADLDKTIELKATPLAYRIRADFRAARRDYPGALGDLGEAIRLAPGDADVLKRRGVLQDWSGQHELAIADFSESIRLKPEPDTFAARGEAEANLGRLDDGLADYDTALQRKPDVAAAWHGKGRILYRRDAFADAADAFRRSVALDPKQAYYPLWLYLAMAHLGEDAKGELARNAAALDQAEWPAPIVDLYLGRVAPDAVVAPPHEREVFRLGWKLEEAFYKGELLLLAGDRTGAAALFRAGLATGVLEFIEYPQAAAELERLHD